MINQNILNDCLISIYDGYNYAIECRLKSFKYSVYFYEKTFTLEFYNYSSYVYARTFLRYRENRNLEFKLEDIIPFYFLYHDFFSFINGDYFISLIQFQDIFQSTTNCNWLQEGF
jgi:hypothetical protein